MNEDGRPPGRRARWTTRFGAWLIDVVLLAALVGVVGDLVGPGMRSALYTPVGLGRQGLLLFVYWTLFEGRTGQSPGKLALDLQVVDEAGHPPSLAAAAVESFGKAFLLPLDVLVGVLAMPGEGLRLFNRLSDTAVVEVDEPPQAGGATATTA